MPSKRYDYAEDILPAEMLQACYDRLGTKFKWVTVRAGGPLCPSEKALGSELAWTLRYTLQTPTAGARGVYFRGRTPRPPSKLAPLASWLYSRGHTAIAISDALGIRQPCITRAAKSPYPTSARRELPPVSPEHFAEALAAIEVREFGRARPFDAQEMRLFALADFWGRKPAAATRRVHGAALAMADVRRYRDADEARDAAMA